MGWFQRTFFNTPAARIERATIYLEQKEYNKVRLELQELAEPVAQDMYNHAIIGLKEKNLEEALARFSSGDYAGAQEHLELAKEFGATGQEISKIQQEGVEFQRQAKAERIAKKQAKEKTKQIQGNDPIWSLPPDDPRLQYAIHLEGYPVEIREKLIPLGQEFALAVLNIDHNPEESMQVISNFIEKEPASRFERARAAIAAGNHPMAISDLFTFGAEFGHQEIANMHTGALLGQLLASVGRGSDGIEAMNDIIEKDDNPAIRIVRSQLYMQNSQLDKAEKETQALLKEYPKSQQLIRQLAEIRMINGNRISAANVLETGFATCCETGSCSAQRPDVASVRLLTRIYLEDRVLPDRTQELLLQLQGLVQEPTWEDQYLLTLHRRNQDDPIATDIAKQLYAMLKEGDPRQNWIRQAFPLPV